MSLLSNVHLRGVVDNKTGWTSEMAEYIDNRFTPQYNRLTYFLL